MKARQLILFSFSFSIFSGVVRAREEKGGRGGLVRGMYKYIYRCAYIYIYIYRERAFSIHTFFVVEGGCGIRCGGAEDRQQQAEHTNNDGKLHVTKLAN